MAFPVACYPKSSRPGNGGGAAPFVGPLDDYTDTAYDFHFTRRVVSSWEGPLFQIRRASDSESEDIYPDANGVGDVEAIADFVGGSNWFFTKFYGQLGVCDVVQATAGAQPRGGIDINGLPYAYSTADFTSHLKAVGLSVAIDRTTHISVAAAAGYLMDTGPGIVFATLSERRVSNYSSVIGNDAVGSGSPALIYGTNIYLYAAVSQFGAAADRLNIGATSASGTKIADSGTMEVLSYGYGGGGASWWPTGSQFYGGGLYLSDVGNSAADAIQTILAATFNAQSPF